jgi:predicted GIY-YIG superfamily endonuclease
MLPELRKGKGSMFYVYILSNRSGQLSAGVTRHIAQRLQDHQLALAPDCTHKHQFDRLLLLESFGRSAGATAREEQLNRCTLTEKLELIRVANPHLDDLSPTLQS